MRHGMAGGQEMSMHGGKNVPSKELAIVIEQIDGCRTEAGRIPELKFTTAKSPSIFFYKSLENQRLRRSNEWATACKRTGVGRVPTRSALSGERGGRGPFTG
jgi:hypothetical protein